MVLYQIYTSPKNVYKNDPRVESIMSNATALAKKRRANLSQNSPPRQQPSVGGGTQSQPDKSKTGLTLPQVIALVDSRLSKLEQQAKSSDSKNAPVESQVDMESLKPILEEYDHRFTMLATQVTELKEIVLKLQTYTMDVNKTLLEERIQFMNETTEETLKDFNVGSDTIKLDDLVLEDPSVVSSFDQAITEELAGQEVSEDLAKEAAIPVDNETATGE